MASFLDRLFRRHGKAPKDATPSSNADDASLPFTVGVPSDYPPELLVGVTRRKRRVAGDDRPRQTEDEFEAEKNVYAEEWRKKASIRAEYDLKRCEAIGITHYRWRASRGADSCLICRGRDGKVFPYRGTKGFEHPGMIRCTEGDYCRCTASSIIPGSTK